MHKVFFILFVSIVILLAQFQPNLSKSTISDPLIPDFQVNENVGTQGCDQYIRDVLCDKEGNYIIIWYDERNAEYDFYMQKYSKSREPIGKNIKLDDIKYSNMEFNSKNEYIIVYTDNKAGDDYYSEIYFQKYDSNNRKIGDYVRVSEEHLKSWQSYPHIGVLPNDNFVIIWEGYQKIFYQFYNSNGVQIGNNQSVNDDRGEVYCKLPEIYVKDDGDFIIVWAEGSSEYSDIYAQCFSKNMERIDGNVRIDELDNDNLNPYIAVTNFSGNYGIFWTNYGTGDYTHKLSGQFISTDGKLLEQNFDIYNNENCRSYFPNVHKLKNGDALLLWEVWDSKVKKNYLFAQRYDKYGSEVNDKFIVENDAEDYVGYPHVCGYDDYMVAWMSSRSGDHDVCAQFYNEYDEPIGANIKVNDDKGSSYQYIPKIAAMENGNFAIAWYDLKSYKYDLYVKFFDYNGNQFKNNIFVNNPEDINVDDFDISIINNENYLVSWIASDGDSTFLFGKLFDQKGELISDDLKIYNNPYNPNSIIGIASDESDNFSVLLKEIVLVDGPDDSVKIYNHQYQLGESQPTKISKIFESDKITSWADIAFDCNSKGEFILVLEERIDYAVHAIARKYSSFMDSDSYQQITLTKEYRNDSVEPKVALTENGNFLLTWIDEVDYNYQIKSKFFNSKGGTKEKVIYAGDGATYSMDHVLANNEEGNFIVSWDDVRFNDQNIFAQKISSNGGLEGENFLVTSYTEKEQDNPDVAFSGNRMYFTWEDNRAGGTGLDIWANVIKWEDFGGDGSYYILDQNYPNPFNQSTQITYHVLQPSKVKLNIYDLSGRLIKNAINQFHEFGTYNYYFNPLDMSSGIYFYRLQIGNSQFETKKMVYLK